MFNTTRLKTLSAIATVVLGCGMAVAQNGNWLMSGGDVERSGWNKDEHILSKSNVGKLKLLWKTKTDVYPQGLHTLMDPLVVQNVPTADGPKEVSTDDIFKGKKVVLFAVPGAFTPTCSAKHLPGFVQNAAAFKAKGVDEIVCLAVNDAFVMGAWAKDQGVGDGITMLADGSAAFTKALGLELDLVPRGMGVRSQRFALVAQDGKVTHLAVEAPGGFDVSRAEAVLAAL